MGVSRWPVHDFNHRTTSDMWLYRAYSGNLYHNGEQTLTLSSFTQGDFITCVLDMEARTVSFGKNGEVRGEKGEQSVIRASEKTLVRLLLEINSSFSNYQCLIPKEPKLAFEDVDATELYPCVMFYSSNPGEKVGGWTESVLLNIHSLRLSVELINGNIHLRYL